MALQLLQVVYARRMADIKTFVLRRSTLGSTWRALGGGAAWAPTTNRGGGLRFRHGDSWLTGRFERCCWLPEEEHAIRTRACDGLPEGVRC